MDIESYIQEAIFGENEQHTCNSKSFRRIYV